jgi:hypothetical protein
MGTIHAPRHFKPPAPIPNGNVTNGAFTVSPLPFSTRPTMLPQDTFLPETPRPAPAGPEPAKAGPCQGAPPQLDGVALVESVRGGFARNNRNGTVPP